MRFEVEMVGVKKWRRPLGVSVCLLPIAGLVGSALAPLEPRFLWFGVVALVAAAAVATLNFYLSFIRPRVYQRRQGSLDGYRHVSGIPMIGTALTLVGAALSFGSAPCALFGIGIYASDTGGALWFVIATWKDSSFWSGDRDAAGELRP